MTIQLPEIDINTASLDELKAHVGLCAAAENELRAHVISVQMRIITLQHVDVTDAPIRRKQVTRQKPKSVRDRYHIEEEEFSIDDFR